MYGEFGTGLAGVFGKTTVLAAPFTSIVVGSFLNKILTTSKSSHSYNGFPRLGAVIVHLNL